MAATLLEPTSQLGPENLPVEREDIACPRITVEREDITFHNVTAERVSIAIGLTNNGDAWSPPTQATILAAPLGAFVPWRPLFTLEVPALAPGQRHVLRAEAVREKPAVLGAPDRLPPRQLLTALGSEDSPQPARSLRDRMRRQLRRRLFPDRPDAVGGETNAATLPADLFDLIGRTNPHWAGNLNVFVGQRPVERHLAKALRIYPGRVNCAMFVVGSCTRDAYSFALAGSGAHWSAALYDSRSFPSLLIGRPGHPRSPSSNGSK